MPGSVINEATERSLATENYETVTVELGVPPEQRIESQGERVVIADDSPVEVGEPSSSGSSHHPEERHSRL